MAILSFLLSLAGATMLLLFAVRMVRTGIERSFGASFQRMMTQERGPLSNSALGVMLATVLQSSAAVALLASGFVAGGYLQFPAALAIVLGGDLGSALVIQILSFRLDWLVPVLLAIGGWLFVKVEERRWRQAGRILMGVAFILISLRFLREAMDPIRDSAFLPAIAEYLARDYLTAFLVGAALAFVMHSSVAAILMCVTLVQIDAIPFAAGLSLVLGANLGSAVIPVWLTRGMGVAAQRVPYTNLLLRGVWAVVALFAVNLFLRSGVMALPETGQMLVMAHIAFNALLVLMAMPFGKALAASAERFMPEPGQNEGAGINLRPGSALDIDNIGTPAQVIASLKKELLRMSEMVEVMFRPSLQLYRENDGEKIKAVQALDHEVNDCLTGIRDYVAALPNRELGRENVKAVRDLMEYAIRLETAGDVVAKRLCVLAQEMAKTHTTFSLDGWAELTRMHESILSNLNLASNVLVSDDLESARLLSLEKTEVKRAERKSRKKHLKRLQMGEVASFETSDIHLETLRALREFNSHIAAVAYPLLYKHGQLLETRLIEDMNEAED
ncbi:Na/Pi cotransporter family protein [Aliiroseovarius crassostreae]|uniref:Na/Pi cotransporter family protein n=1 Tax=Aliiroseovarius crassostreae TaxID=154981 RepID=A0A9Q9H9N8_9RHOB|nr:Na/Pi cotransporter family protein [Aliiroseovarius crassostreae]UWP95488.1 Na/Pi cotransporter family protein [Aliiroseovarius crassostreae]